jgi:hypothetical protein
LNGVFSTKRKTKPIIVLLFCLPILIAVSRLIVTGYRFTGLLLFVALVIVTALLLRPQLTTAQSKGAAVPFRSLLLVGCASFLGSWVLLISGLKERAIWEINVSCVGLIASLALLGFALKSRNSGSSEA